MLVVAGEGEAVTQIGKGLACKACGFPLFKIYDSRSITNSTFLLVILHAIVTSKSTSIFSLYGYLYISRKLFISMSKVGLISNSRYSLNTQLSFQLLLY